MSSVASITSSTFAQYIHQPAVAPAGGGGSAASPSGTGSADGSASSAQAVETETYAQLLQQASQGNQAAIKQLAKLEAEQVQQQQALSATTGAGTGAIVDQEA